jgi:serine/threonine protein kinase
LTTALRAPVLPAAPAIPSVPTELVEQVADADSETGSAPPIHEIPTRGDEGEADRSLTSFLSPARGPGEIGWLGPYRILSVVGAGGMGVVFKAEDIKLQRTVALKVMLPALAASATARERFRREAQAAAQIQHDRIVAIYHVDEANGIPYLTMPFLKGESLDARLKKPGGPLSVAEVLRIGLQIAEGLAAIHELGLVHRDIKPGNVWLEPVSSLAPAAKGAGEGEQRRVKILDFGLARAARADTQLTQEGAIIGSPAFMAPEQANRKPIDPRADLFSLGCVLYLMATGSLPFEGDDALSTLVAITCVDPPPPHERNPAVSPEVSQLILSLLAKNPADRPASAQEVIEAISKLG